jgi:hypothetical protein
MSDVPPVGEISYSRECHPEIGDCFQSSAVNWCAKQGELGCTGGSLGGRNVLSMTDDERRASTELFYGTDEEEGLKIIYPGAIKGTLAKGDLLLSVNGKKLKHYKERTAVLNWAFDTEMVDVQFRRDGQLMHCRIPNPYKKDE